MAEQPISPQLQPNISDLSDLALKLDILSLGDDSIIATDRTAILSEEDEEDKENNPRNSVGDAPLVYEVDVMKDSSIVLNSGDAMTSISIEPPSSESERPLQVGAHFVSGIDLGSEIMDENQWMNASDFANVQNPTEWDMLLTRGSGLPSVKDLARDSLFVKFDPLVPLSRELPPQPDPVIERDEPSGEVFDCNLEVGENGNENEGFNNNSAVETPAEAAKPPVPLFNDFAIPISRPTTKTEDEHDWVSATDFATTQNPEEWDMLLTRGSGIPSAKNLARDSLFVKFDPLVPASRELPMQIDPVTEQAAEHVNNTSGRISDSNDIGNVNENERSNSNIIDHAVVETSDQLVDAGTPLDINKPDTAELDAQTEKMKLLEEKVQAAMKEYQALELALENSIQSNQEIRKETILAKEDLSEMETAFAEVLLCYESGKVYQKNFELNKKTLTERIAQLEKRASRMDEKYEYTDSKVQEMTIKVKQDQESRLNILNSENFKLKASVKMGELKIQKLENEIEHMTTSNGNLQKLCDEMIQQC